MVASPWRTTQRIWLCWFSCGSFWVILVIDTLSPSWISWLCKAAFYAGLYFMTTLHTRACARSGATVPLDKHTSNRSRAKKVYQDWSRYRALTLDFWGEMSTPATVCSPCPPSDMGYRSICCHTTRLQSTCCCLCLFDLLDGHNNSSHFRFTSLLILTCYPHSPPLSLIAPPLFQLLFLHFLFCLTVYSQNEAGPALLTHQRRATRLQRIDISFSSQNYCLQSDWRRWFPADRIKRCLST